MAIIVNVDVMLAKRKLSVTELTERGWNHDGKYLNIEKWKGEGYSIFNFGRHM